MISPAGDRATRASSYGLARKKRRADAFKTGVWIKTAGGSLTKVRKLNASAVRFDALLMQIK